MNVLIVEDDPTSRKLAHLVLESEGYTVDTAEGPEKAMIAIKKARPAVILMDLELPGMDGLSLTRMLKKDPETRDIPVIAITSYPDRFPREEAMKAGCDAFVVKPIDTRKLPQQVSAVLKRGQ